MSAVCQGVVLMLERACRVWPSGSVLEGGEVGKSVTTPPLQSTNMETYRADCCDVVDLPFVSGLKWLGVRLALTPTCERHGTQKRCRVLRAHTAGPPRSHTDRALEAAQTLLVMGIGVAARSERVYCKTTRRGCMIPSTA